MLLVPVSALAWSASPRMLAHAYGTDCNAPVFGTSIQRPEAKGT